MKRGFEMQISRERKIEEAVRRMKTLGIIDDAISQFQKDGTVLPADESFLAASSCNLGNSDQFYN